MQNYNTTTTSKRCTSVSAYDVSEYDIIYEWEAGNPVREVGTYPPHLNMNKSITTFIYTEYPCYIGNYQMLLGVYEIGGSSLDPFLMQCGFYGKLPTNLVKAIKHNNGRFESIEYSMNSNYYPVKISFNEEPDNEIILTWE